MHRRTPRGLALAAAVAALATAACLAPAPRAQAAPAPRAAGSDPGSLMLVLDASGSMGETLPSGGGTKIVAARAAMHDVIGSLPADQPTGLRVFGATTSKSSGKACTDSQRLAAPATGNRAALDAAVDRIRPFGETPIGYALQQAGKDLGSGGQRTIVLVSDGEPTCEPDPCQVAAQLVKDGVSLRIDVVGLSVSGKARSALRCIAEQGDGHYYDADSADDLSRALDTTATRAAQPFGETGTPVRGTTAPQGAPLLTTGSWLDRIGGSDGDDKTRYYRVRRTTAGSTLHVSADSVLRGDDDVLGVALIGPDERQCGQSTGTGVGAAFDPLLVASVSVPESLDAYQASCAKVGDYLVRVTHGFQGFSGGTTKTIPVELQVREEAPVRDVGSLPETVTTAPFTGLDPAARPTPAVGGASLSAATPLEPGSISGGIVVGELQAFSVPVGWGQSLAVQVRPTITTTFDQGAPGGPDPVLAVKILSPARADARASVERLSAPSNARRNNSALTSASEGLSVYEFTGGVAYRNRFVTDSTRKAASEAGRYLVVVSLQTPGGSAPAQTPVLPFTLTTAVRGSVSGAPTYTAGGASGSLGTTSPAASPSASPGTSTAAASPAGGAGADRAADPFSLVRSVAAWSAIGVGVLALAGGAVLLIVMLRRRAGGPRT